MRYERNDNMDVEYARYAGITRISLKGSEAALRLASQSDLHPTPLLFLLDCDAAVIFMLYQPFKLCQDLHKPIGQRAFHRHLLFSAGMYECQFSGVQTLSGQTGIGFF